MIADKVYSLDSFKRQYEALLILSVCDTIPQLVWQEDKESLLAKIDWNNLLSIASILSYSLESSHLDAALRIAQTCLTQKSCSEIQKNASAVILDSLTNKLAIKMAKNKKYLSSDYEVNYPIALKLQRFKTDFEHSIIIKDKIISLNRFQKTVYDAHKVNDTISISAPTSAGKSFILCNILLEELLGGNKNIVYLVPTRALISQVETDLRELIKTNQLEQVVNISTVPQQENTTENISNVFVFTQERLHWFLADNPNIPLHLLIVDEAHKIEDGSRGILLQQKLEEVVKFNSDIKVYFSSPFTSNPEILLDNVQNNSQKDKVNTQFVAVNQNLIYATQYPRKPQIWQLHVCTIEKLILIGTLTLKDRPTGEFKKIALISEQLAERESGSLIYCNGAAEAEEISLLLFNNIAQEPIPSEIAELIKLVKSTIHSKYALAKVLERGIAFHYGNMPLLIRQEIEKLFTEGKIKYLVCTSTLLEGVNLPAKSIVIRKPTRGRNKPLNSNLDRYRDSEFVGEDGRIFKLQTHVNMNWQLKRLAKIAKIDRRLTFHMSRFSFATTVCLTGGVPIETLSQMMGHLSIKTTQIYAEVTRTKINEDMTNLAETIQGKYELPEDEGKIYKMGRRNRRFPEREINENRI